MSQSPRSTETGGDTIRQVLAGYEIGSKLRQLRLQKKISLVDLGKQTGLSASMLSQLENGKLIPTLPTLARIAMVFDVGVEHFFVDQRKRHLFLIVRANERMRFPADQNGDDPGYYFECLAFSGQEKSLHAYLAEFPNRPIASARDHCHEGAEFIHVLEGLLLIRYQEEEYRLGAGDSAYFDSTQPHGYAGGSSAPTRAIVITTPPRL